MYRVALNNSNITIGTPNDPVIIQALSANEITSASQDNASGLESTINLIH